MSVRFDTTKSESDVETEQYSLSQEMNWGIEFEGIGESEKISESYTHEL